MHTDQHSKSQIWLHKPSGVKYRKGASNGAVNLMQALSTKPRFATDEELRNSETWSKV